MSEKMNRDSIERYIADAREFKFGGSNSAEIIKFYSSLPLPLRLAMFFCPGGPVNEVPPESRLELEELQLLAFMRLPWQSRADLVRRAEAFLAKTFKVDIATLEPKHEQEPLPDGMMLPVESTSTADVLRLFRAFVIKGATQWQLGCNHNPIWELVAEHVEGPDPTSGPEYEFIYPTNRTRLSVLKKLAEDRAIE